MLETTAGVFVAKGARGLLGVVSGLLWGLGTAVILQQLGVRHFDPLLVYVLPAGAAVLSGLWARRKRRHKAAFLVLLAPVLLSQGAECWAWIDGFEPSLSDSNAGNPVVLPEDFGDFTVLVEVPGAGEGEAWVEFGGIHVPVGSGLARAGLYEEYVERGDLGPFSAPGLYHVGGTVSGVCSGDGYIRIEGRPWGNPIGQAAIGAVVVGLLGTWLAGRRPSAGRTQPPEEGYGPVDQAAAGESAAQLPVAAGSFRPPRIQALLFDESTGRGLTQFVAGRSHRIEVRIAAAEPDWSAAMGLEGSGPRELTIALIEPRLLATPAMAVVRQAGAAASGPAAFHLEVPVGVTVIDARLVALDDNRVLHTVRLPADVIAGAGPGPALTDVSDVGSAETTVAAVRAGPAARPMDAALIVNHSHGTPRITGFAGRQGAVVDIGAGDVAEAVDKIRRRLGEIVAQPEDFGALDAPGTVELLIFLAYHGRLLRNALTGDYLNGRLANADALQVVSATPDAYFPFEFAYDFPAPAVNAGLCPEAVGTLRSQDPLLRCPGDHSEHTVCPLGFWGLSRIIERHAYQPGERLPAGFLLRSVPRSGRNRLVEGPVLVAASDRVDAVTPGAGAHLGVTLGEHHGDVLQASQWDTWIEGVASGRALTILLPHTVYSDTLDTYGLEIGASDRRWAADIDARFVPPEDRPVLVVLLGCETAAAGAVSYERFPGLFRRAGAEVVLGTLTEMLGRHAVPIAEALSGQIRDGWRHGPLRIGEAMVRIRRRLIADGLAATLAVIAFGDADWVLDAGSTTPRGR